MIKPGVFTLLADKHDVDAYTVERDYVLTHVLAAICQQDLSTKMVFKGGTALRLCFFEDYRYSADLDFSLVDQMTKAEAVAVVEAAVEELRSTHDFPHLAVAVDGQAIDYIGPLGKPRGVKLDLADDELVENHAKVPLLKRYEDQPGRTVTAYTLEEVAAEKLRCVIQRVQARDLFDLHELLVYRDLSASEIWPTFERKARHKSIDPGRFFEMFDKRVPAWEKRWDEEMEMHVPADARPHFQQVQRKVRQAVRSQRP